MDYSFASTKEAIALIHPDLAALVVAGHVRMDLTTLLDRAAREYFMKFCGPDNECPTQAEAQAGLNIHAALFEMQTKSSFEFGAKHYTTASVPIKRCVK